MTREEAIQVFQRTIAYESDFAEAKRMAIEALKAEEIMVIQTGQTHGKSAYIKELAEVVRCKDCRHFTHYADGCGVCNERNNIITYQNQNDFCSYGELAEQTLDHHTETETNVDTKVKHGRLIDADALPYKTHKWHNPDGQAFEWTVVDKADIDDAPTVDILGQCDGCIYERPHGEWIVVETNKEMYDRAGVHCWGAVFRCDQCSFTTYAVEGHFAQYKYCPHCGAQMDLRGDNNE